MPLRNNRERHYSSLNFGDTSVFTSKFPVDLSNHEVATSVRKQIPAYLDTVFLVRGSAEEFSTVQTIGRIPLHPAMTQAALGKTEGQEHRSMKNRHATLNAMTDGASLSAAHVQVNREEGIITDFSIVAADESVKRTPYYELRGAINGPGDEDVFEVAKHGADKEEWSTLVDENLARDFVHALHEHRYATPAEPVPLDASIMRLLDASPEIHHQQSTFLEVDEEPGVKLSAERRNRIRNGITKIAGFHIVRHEVQVLGDLEINHSFGLSYDTASSPRYTADVAYLMRTLGDSPTHEEREAHFESLSIHFRERPGRLFGALAEATKKLASFDL